MIYKHKEKVMKKRIEVTGKDIKELRKARGETQQEFAQLMYVAIKTLSGWENRPDYVPDKIYQARLNELKKNLDNN